MVDLDGGNLSVSKVCLRILKVTRDAARIAGRTRSAQGQRDQVLDLLAYRIESGRVEMKFESLNLKTMADGIADMFAPALKEKNIELIVDAPPDLPLVKADKSQAERILINLMGNAVKFTPAGGQISIKARPFERQMLQVSVNDNGIGIAENDLDKIFEEFYRVDNEVNAKVKGTGLGLALVKYIVEAHKGKLTVSSKLNNGSSFAFTLPVA